MMINHLAMLSRAQQNITNSSTSSLSSIEKSSKKVTKKSKTAASTTDIENFTIESLIHPSHIALKLSNQEMVEIKKYVSSLEAFYSYNGDQENNKKVLNKSKNASNSNNERSVDGSDTDVISIYHINPPINEIQSFLIYFNSLYSINHHDMTTAATTTSDSNTIMTPSTSDWEIMRTLIKSGSLSFHSHMYNPPHSIPTITTTSSKIHFDKTPHTKNTAVTTHLLNSPYHFSSHGCYLMQQCVLSHQLFIISDIIRFVTDLTERDVIEIIQFIFSLPDTVFANTNTATATTTAIASIITKDSDVIMNSQKDVPKSIKTNKKRKNEEIIDIHDATTIAAAAVTVSTAAGALDGGDDVLLLNQLLLIQQLLTNVLNRCNGFSNILLTSAIKKYMTPSMAIFVLKTFVTIVQDSLFLNNNNNNNIDLHNTTTTISNNNNNSLSMMTQAVIWIESIFDAHLHSIAIYSLHKETTRIVLKKLIDFIHNLQSSLLFAESTMSTCLHVSRMQALLQMKSRSTTATATSASASATAAGGEGGERSQSTENLSTNHHNSSINSNSMNSINSSSYMKGRIVYSVEHLII